jgi:DNA-binding ferritin-like protein
MLTIYGPKMQETSRLYKKQNNILQELVSRLEDIKGMSLKEKKRKEHFSDKSTKKSIQAAINFLQKQLHQLQLEINKRIDNDKQLKAKT